MVESSRGPRTYGFMHNMCFSHVSEFQGALRLLGSHVGPQASRKAAAATCLLWTSCPINKISLEVRKVARATDSTAHGTIMRRRALCEGPRSVPTTRAHKRDSVQKNQGATGLAQGTIMPSDRLRDLRAGALRCRERHRGRHQRHHAGACLMSNHA